MYFKINLSQLIISFYFLIIFSCITMLLNFEFLIILNSLVYLFALFYFIFFKINVIFKIFIFLLIVINLGTITTSWDARSIWLFKTKIFFYEENILISTHIHNFHILPTLLLLLYSHQHL